MISKLPDPSKFKESPLQKALDPATHDPEYEKARVAVQQHQWDRALKLLRSLAVRYPTHPAVQFNHGLLAVMLKLYPEAETAFRAVTADKSKAAQAWYLVSVVQYKENRPRDAAASARHCVDAAPPTVLAALAWSSMGYYDSVAGDHAGAVKSAQQGTKLEPKSAFTWSVRGFCEAGNKQYDAAIADYQHAISLNNRSAFAYEGLGIAYTQANRPGDAIAPLKTALALSPRNFLSATELGYCYLRSGQPADGVRACKQALVARPGFSKAWDVLGMCYQRLGKGRDAVGAFEQAVKAEPGNTAARAHLDEARRAGGNVRA